MIAYLEDFDRRVMTIARTTLLPSHLSHLKLCVCLNTHRIPRPGVTTRPLSTALAQAFLHQPEADSRQPEMDTTPLMIHEELTGHHFQISTSQLIDGVPLLRRLSPSTRFRGLGLVFRAYRQN